LKFREKVKLALDVMNDKAVSWSHNGGFKNSTLFDGSKFSGGMKYPGAWGLDNEVLRDRSRLSYFESSHARAMLGRLNDNVINDGLVLQSTPIWELLEGVGTEEETRRKIVRDIELRFHLFMASKELDASGKLSGYELQGFVNLNEMRDGELFGILRYNDDSSRMSTLSMQTILPEQVQTPLNSIILDAVKAAGRRIEDGIEIDSNGKEIAIYVQDPITLKSKRIPCFGASKRFVIHPMISDILGSVRGTPILAPVVHELKKITDYEVAEIEAAVLNACIASWVEPSPDKNASKVLDAIKNANKNGSTSNEQNSSDNQTTFSKPGWFVQNLKAGEKISSFATSRPNVNFKGFIDAVMESVSASLSIPIEVLRESFNANYSASRASLLLFWNKVIKDRAHFASQFLNPIFEAWLSEEVRQNKIKLTGFSDGGPLIRAAWLDCSWIGKSYPSIDPKKEADAADVRIAAGATTREREAQIYNGSDFMDNCAKLKAENEKLSEANKSVQPKESSSNFNSIQKEDPEDDESKKDGGMNE
jgi:lambda family phage portal protein